MIENWVASSESLTTTVVMRKSISCLKKSPVCLVRGNRVKRLKFAKKHILKPQQFWNEVIFSDESKFNIFGSDGRRWCGVNIDISHHPKHTIPTVKHGGGSVMNGCYTIAGINWKYNKQSPDLNVIDNLWSHLERAVQKHEFTSKEQLKPVLQEEWLNIAPETTRHLVESMPQTIGSVISAKRLCY
ncbi:transposable element Tcb1 transposase [Trichonephila clavipes]|nr:transposable element Tcb1 transposase [Trichonephila clavipes]